MGRGKPKSDPVNHTENPASAFHGNVPGHGLELTTRRPSNHLDTYLKDTIMSSIGDKQDPTIVSFRVRDLRFPVSLSGIGTDAMNLASDNALGVVEFT